MSFLIVCVMCIYLCAQHLLDPYELELKRVVCHHVDTLSGSVTLVEALTAMALISSSLSM